MGIVPLVIYPSDLFEKKLCLVPMTLSSAGLDVLVPDGAGLLPGQDQTPLNWKFRLSPWPLWVSDPPKPIG